MNLYPFFVPILEIIIIWVIISYLLKFFWGTRAMDVVLGFLAFLLIFFLASWFEFPVLEKLMRSVVSVAMIAVLVIFQPELRLALSKVRIRGKKFREIHEVDPFIERLTESIYRLSEKQIGALVVLENQDSYKQYASSFLRLKAKFSSELLESLFMTTTPLHDGAIVIRDTIIETASTILPLSQETSQLSRSMGTRHRAALGASQKTDALIIVVSEETGKVSIARDGILTRGVKLDRFRGILRSVFHPPEKKKNWKWRI